MPRSSFIRSSILAAAVSLGLTAPLAYAQSETQEVKEVENSKFTTRGIITSNAVYVRCGPGDNYYPTTKLDKGAKVQVVGAKFDWLKVVPPEGSFCYVAKLYVDRHGDGSVGRVNKDSINVRAGSSLSALKIGILCELSQGSAVEILGEEQEYFKIKPPEGAYLYINKKFVEPDPEAKPEVQVAKADTPKPDTTNPGTVRPDTTNPDTTNPDTTNPGNDTPKPEVKPETKPENTADAAKPEMKPEVKPENTDTTRPPNTPETTADAAKPEVKPEVKPENTDTSKPPTNPETVRPTVLTPEVAEAAFDKAESAFLAAKGQPLDQQPLDALVGQFEPLAKADVLPESMRRVAESRLITLKARQSAQQELAKLRASQDDLKKRQIALEAEQQELQKRIAENTVKVYTVVGTLQPSSLQQGQGGTLFRITDPATGRTVCYIRSNDRKTLDYIGAFVGIRGELTTDQRLGARVVATPAIESVDANRLHQSITAQIIPPSLMPREPASANIDPSR